MMLIIDGLSCSYGTAAIIDGLHLELGAGEVLSVLGRNGMGKTTMVKAIAGIRPPEVRHGSIRYADKELTKIESFEIARLGIGLVPQGRHVFGSLTVVENLNVTARPPLSDAEPWTLDRVFGFFPRLAERTSSFARNLSGGEQQMLAIGRALMTNPSLLLMDEPSEGLAPIVLGAIRDRLLEIKGPDLSILLVEQNLGLALSLADRIAIMGAHGQIVWTGTPDELRQDEEAKKNHLGV
jgi:branched-chain amino acid transport system ATP-binding protein